MVKRILTVIIAGLLLLLSFPVKAQADDRGLFMSPLRQEVVLDAGQTKHGEFTIGNETGQPMEVALAVKQFTVTDHSYDYRFSNPDYDWVRLEATKVQLQPRQHQTIRYELAVPLDTPPAGYYFTVIASTTLESSGSPITVQAATLLYLTITGDVQRAASLGGIGVPTLVVSAAMPYDFEVKNSGTVHFAADFFVRFGGNASQTSGIMMPGTTRTIAGTVASPVWPGIYEVTYGYEADFQSGEVARTVQVVFVPVWLLALVGVLLLVGLLLLGRLARRRTGG